MALFKKKTRMHFAGVKSYSQRIQYEAGQFPQIDLVFKVQGSPDNPESTKDVTEITITMTLQEVGNFLSSLGGNFNACMTVMPGTAVRVPWE